MNTDEKILKALETLQADVNDVKQGQGTLEKGQGTLEKDLQDIKQTQGAHTTTLGQHKTMVEAVLAGQKELQETVATRADVLRVGVKVDSLRKRIEGIEEHTGSSTHKN